MSVTGENAPTVLVVEDDPDQGFIYEQFLGREGFRVATAATVDEAKALLRDERPDAVILDLSMGGLSLLGHIRAHDATRDVAVFVVSGTRLEEDGPWDHFLEKPTNLSALAELLRAQTSR